MGKIDKLRGLCLVNLYIAIHRGLWYHIITEREQQIPREPKALNTLSHILVRNSHHERNNSQEDAQRVKALNNILNREENINHDRKTD